MRTRRLPSDSHATSKIDPMVDAPGTAMPMASTNAAAAALTAIATRGATSEIGATSGTSAVGR